MRSLVLALALVFAFTLTAGVAQAQRPDCPRAAAMSETADDSSAEAVRQFFDDTAKLRAQMRVDKAKIDLLLLEEAPDAEALEALNMNLAQAMTQMQLKAKELGLHDAVGPMMGMGGGCPKMGMGGGCPMMGMGGGCPKMGMGGGKRHGKGHGMGHGM